VFFAAQLRMIEPFDPVSRIIYAGLFAEFSPVECYSQGRAVQPTVRCDLCGKLFSSRYVGSHKRLAHGKPKATVSTAPSDEIEMILRLFRGLPLEKKRRVLIQLAAIEQEAS
jgi:DNA-directed RNA polymerase subunit N (RpoN/RPB10)